jgi:carbon monoxide dehydrogenase subunit G
MFDTTASVKIRRSREDVFDYFADVGNDKEWNPFAKRVEKTSEGPLGVGTTFFVLRKMSGPMNLQYTEYERPLRWALRGKGRGVRFTYAADFAPSADGTELTSHMQFQPVGFMKVLAPLMRSMMGKQLEQVHQALRSKLESAH